MSNTNLELIQMKLPEFYEKYGLKESGEKSVMHTILNAIAHNIDNNMAVTNRLDAAIGVDTTYDEDLQYRWGNLLGINKKDTGSYDLYRSELKLAVPSLIGGTREAIIYAMAIVIGIEKDSALQADYIDVVDGWEYAGDAEIPEKYKKYGCFICTIDMSVGQGAMDMEQALIDSINKVKASGTSFYIVYRAFKVDRYYNLDVFNYNTLDNTTYDKFGIANTKASTGYRR